MKRIASFLLAALVAVAAFAAPSDALLFSLPTPTVRTNVEVIDGQVAFAAGDLVAGDELQVEAAGAQEGTTNASKIIVRLGSTCSASDMNLNAFTPTFLPAGNHSGGTVIVFKLLSNTTIKRMGGVGVAGSFQDGPTQNQFPTNIDNVSLSAVCLSVAVTSDGTTDPVKLQVLRIRRTRP